MERYGVIGTERGGIFFTERAIAGAEMVEPIRVEIARQNANLREVKERMAERARSIGATAIMNFKYGQRAHRPLELLAPKWDTESWYGEGDAVRF